MRTRVPCNENRVFPVGIDLQGVSCKPYRVWVCSASKQPSTSAGGFGGCKAPAKGQLISEWIYQIVNCPKFEPKNSALASKKSAIKK